MEIDLSVSTRFQQLNDACAGRVFPRLRKVTVNPVDILGKPNLLRWISPRMTSVSIGSNVSDLELPLSINLDAMINF
jgi:hypothetical protein